MSVESKVRAVTTLRLKEMKDRGEKIAMLTSYDYSMAKIVDAAGVDVILVGDSAANVMAGYETTVPITLDAMIYHARSVVRAVERALVVVDLPFGTYQGNSKMALDSAIRIMKETEADAVKLEGGEEILESVERILTAGIPIMGHLGLTPQSIHKFGTYTVRAREEAEAEKLVRDARLLEEAGCFAVVLEKIPAVLAERVSKELSIPTIGIGAGGGTDGQVLVIHDMLGINKGFSPRFLRRYADLHTVMTDAVGRYFERDILYRTDASGDYARRMCRLDVACPPDAEDAPVVVWFHGGGLTGGKRAVPEGLMKKGFVVVGVGYRLIPHVGTLDIVDDAAAAVAWVFDHIADYGGSPSKIYIAGHSAGGYLVNMVGLDRSRLARYGKEADSLAGIIPFSGHAITHFAARKALGMSALQPLVDDTAPLYYVRPDCAPMLILSGDRELEMNGRYEETAYFWRMMRLVGHEDVTLCEFDGYDHGNMPAAGYPVAVRFICRLEGIE